MPVTVPAHQLLVVPLLRTRGGRLPGAALMLGTTLPDLAFLAGGYGLSGPAHELWGPLFLAPLGLLLYAWCEAQLAPALRRALPAPWCSLFATRGAPRSAGAWLWATVALAIGAVTHVVLDGFTHHWLWPGELYGDIRVGPLRLTQVLQQVASVALSVTLIVWARRRATRCPAVTADPRWRAHLFGGIAIAFACAWLALAGWLVATGWPVTKHDWARLVCPFADGAFVGLAVATWRKFRVRSPHACDR